MSDEDPKVMAFSHPARLTKAVNMLEGLVRGVTIDRLLNDAEVVALKAWIRENAEFARHPVFGEVITRIQGITETGVADEEVRADLLWFCEKFVDEDEPVDQGTAATQVLHGMMAGIAADNVITVDEVKGLMAWLDDRPYLNTAWPFGDVRTLGQRILADGVVSQPEHDEILSLCKTVIAFGSSRVAKSGSNVFANQPTLEFPNKAFCLSGKLERGKKADAQAAIKERGGKVKSAVSKQLDYLIVGGHGHEAWAYSSYGRKVEAAVNLKQSGVELLIVQETDFWTSIDA